MPSNSKLRRANWPFVLTMVILLGACSLIGRALSVGQSERNYVLVSRTCDTAASDVIAGESFGVGQPLEFYKTVFKPRDVSIGHACACFAPGTDEHVIAYVSEQEMIDPVERYQLGGRWSGSQGTPRALTWSFVPDGLSISGGVGEPTAASELFSRMDSLFAAQGGRATWINRVQQSFDRWAQLCGVTYTRITVGGNDWDDGAGWGTAGAAGARGDIRISMHPIDGTNNILAYTFFPSNGDMVFDRAESWNTSGNMNRFFRNTFMHEHGHGLGLSHVCPANGTKLMEPFLNTSFDGLRHDDIRAGQRHYGDIYENNNTAGTATAMGTLAPGSPISLGALPPPVSGTSPSNSSLLSIDANGKFDYYTFHVDSAVLATATVTPQGLTYLNGPQNGDGTCSAGTNFDSLSQADLAIDLISTDGTTVLATASSNGVGVAETVSNISLPAAGDYYLKVYETNTPTESQLYTLNLSATSACPTITVNPATLPNGTVNQFYSQSLSASGGTGPYTFAVTVGSLPAGLTLSSGGLISGTPTGPSGPTNFTVTATDTSNGCQGSRAYTMTLDCPVEDISPSSLPGALIGQPYGASLSGVGGVAPYTFAIVGGSLPYELSLDPSGTISGTPVDSIGTFNFDVQSTDSAGCTAVRSYSMSVSCSLLGDVNNDGLVNGLDVQGFVDCLMNSGSFPGSYCGCGDMDANGIVEELDTDPFANALLQ